MVCLKKALRIATSYVVNFEFSVEVLGQNRSQKQRDGGDNTFPLGAGIYF